MSKDTFCAEWKEKSLSDCHIVEDLMSTLARYVKTALEMRDANIDSLFEFEIDVFYPSKRSDLDNALKCVLDCLQKARVIKNDNNCCKIVARKFIDKENPREWSKDDFEKLKASITETPRLFEARGIIVYPHDGKYVAIGGNMRLAAARALKYKDVPCIVLPDDASTNELIEIAVKDNGKFGKWDWDKLANSWDKNPLSSWGVPVWDAESPKETPMMSVGSKEEPEMKPAEFKDPEDESDDSAFRSATISDVLYDSDNIFEIPNLLLEMQAGKVELPITPWGANSRLTKGVNTYHFYVDDYRFEKLWKDPINLLTSGCKAIVEPNCSLHDQTPIAWGLQLIYKKRWLSRYLQECGIRVYADLNVSHKFIEYNKMGIPKGYNAFFTRGLTGWIESLKLDLQVAQEISGLEKPNLVVYGGGKDIQQFCRENGLLYLTDFINAKKF